MADKKNINELIALIERNRVASGLAWSGKASSRASGGGDDDDEDEDGEDDYSDVRLLIFAANGPFTDSLLPMLDQQELSYVVTDAPETAIDIMMNNPHIRHVLIDLDRPTNPSEGVNIFSELKMINQNIIIHYCTKNPMTMESRNIQTKGAKLIQKPVLRKMVDQFIAENFKN